MEVDIPRTLAKRWLHVDQISYFVHHEENHAMTILHDELKWDLAEKLDKNHVIKTLDDRFTRCSMIPDQRARKAKPATAGENKEGCPRKRNALNGLHDHLVSWFRMILNFDNAKTRKRNSGSGVPTIPSSRRDPGTNARSCEKTGMILNPRRR
jgi:hypothetical protein